MFAWLAARTGSWDLGDMSNHPEFAPLFWLALVGFGVKAGLFPLHFWLPSAHANAPSHVSAIMSGVALKMGIYGIVRFSSWLPMPSGASWTVVSIGVVSAVLGVVFALGQHDYKRLLAYHSVENIGIILMGIGFALVAAGHGNASWGRLALAGGLLHVWNHGLFKSLLFLGAGSVLHATGTRVMSRLGGLWRAMPWTTGLFALGAAAISGLPPLNGFVSEFLIYLGLFDPIQGREALALPAIAAVVLLAITGALALACFVKVCGIMFLGAPRSADAGKAHECGGLMRGPMIFLGILCVAIGLFSPFFWGPVSTAATAWRSAWPAMEAPASLVSLAHAHLIIAGGLLLAAIIFYRFVRGRIKHGSLTWDCGYAAPSPRMQYTAGSFASTLTGWFDWVLQRTRHVSGPKGIFPEKASFEEHTPETVLEKIIQPLSNYPMRMAAIARKTQHGRLQFYLLYLIIAVFTLAMIVLWMLSQ